jgi:WD40 repeat protein
MKRIVLPLAFAALASPAAAQIYLGTEFFGENKITYDHFVWKTYRSTHFTIYFYDKEAVSLQKVASFAESAYDERSRQLNFQIPKPINLIYYATHSDFEQTNTLLNFIPEGVGAFALPSRNRMVLPVDLPDEKLQQLIGHELTHVFQFEILFGGNYLRAATTNAPQWFLEGMASYYGDDEDNKDRMVLRDAVLADQVPEIAEREISGFFAYRFGHAVFDFIAAEWGKDAVRDFIFEFRSQIGATMEKPIKRAFNISAEDFDIKFRRYLRQRYLRILTEKGEPIDFGERFKIEDTPSAELSPRAYPSGDFVAAISTYKEDADVVVLSTRDRKLFRNLTKGRKTSYEYVVAQWVTTGPQNGADVAVSSDGNTVAVFARRERGRDLLLLNALDGGIRERIEMPELDQQLSPAFSPDGSMIVFRAFKGGRSDIFAYHTASKTITNLTDDDAFDFAPTFSPDGKWIYYSSTRGTHAKIFRFPPESPESREQVTYGDWNDEDPALSPDGKRLFFTSDRDGGIYNIYSVNLETGETLLHTNVVAGAFAPTVFTGKDNAEKLVFAAYYKRRFTLYIADTRKPVRRLPELNPSVSPATPGAIAPFQPAIEVAVDREKVQQKPARKLFLENAQVIAGVNTDQTFYSDTVLIFGDNLGDRRLIAVVASLSGYTQYDLAYWDLSHRLQKGIEIFDNRTYYVGFQQLGNNLFLTRQRQAARYTGGLFLGNYPLSRYYRFEGQLGFISRSVDYTYLVPSNVPGQLGLGFAHVDNNYPTAGVSLVGDTVEYQEWGPRSGFRFKLSYVYAPDFKKNQSLPPGSAITSTLTQDVSADLREYIPISKRMLFALRFAGLSSTGNVPDICAFGGVDTLRGIGYGTLFGNSCAYANFEFRFPLIDVIALPWIGFRGIRGHVFLDVGGSKLKTGTFQLWNSEEKRLQDAMAAFGWGFDIDFLGLPFHVDFARQTDLKTTLSGFKGSWYIGYQF